MPDQLYSEQDVETKVIVPQLGRLGYCEGTPAAVSLRFQHSIEVHQGRSTKKIRADIVVFVHDLPLIVVDAKNPRQFLTEDDREQVISYARLLDCVAPYAVLCNGATWQVFDTVNKAQLARLPSLSEIARSRAVTLPPPQRQQLAAQARRTLFAIDSARELSRIMRRCHDIIRNQRGFDPAKAFDELSKLLFAKMHEEREVAEGRRPNNRFSIETVRAMRREGVDIIQTLWHDTVSSERYREVFSEDDATPDLDLPPEAIDEIVSVLETVSLGQTDLDVKGIAFEEFLSATYRGGGLGQYFTPREIVNFMVDIADPAIGETVIDPACGTGGFLIRAYDVLSEKIRNSAMAERDKQASLEQLANQSLAGIDWEARAARTCKMNMIIHGDGHAGVYRGNALDRDEIDRKVQQRRLLSPDAPGVEEGTYDVVLTNPPFGARDKVRRILRQYELGTGASQKREVLMLERCVRLLRPGGRLVAVIPEGILSNKLDQRIRDYICRECVVVAVIRLPQDAFAMSQGAKCTSILYAVKRDEAAPGSPSQDLFLARADQIGFTPSGKPIPENDLIAIRDHLRRFQQGDWNGIELSPTDMTTARFLREQPTDDGTLWLEPVVNRTSLLYDRLSYVVRDAELTGRFSYTYMHPEYYRVMGRLRQVGVPVACLADLCLDGYPSRGRKPAEESIDGIPIIKVRNVTGQGVSLDTDYAPDTDDVWAECAAAVIRKGDVLITSTGEGTIGRVDLYPYDENAIADGHVAICRPAPGVVPEFLLEYLRGEYGQIQMLRHISGSTGQTELLIEHVCDILVPVPSRADQEAFVAHIAEARAVTDRMAACAQDLRSRASNLLAQARARATEEFLGDSSSEAAPPRAR